CDPGGNGDHRIPAATDDIEGGTVIAFLYPSVHNAPDLLLHPDRIPGIAAAHQGIIPEPPQNTERRGGPSGNTFPENQKIRNTPKEGPDRPPFPEQCTGIRDRIPEPGIFARYAIGVEAWYGGGMGKPSVDKK